MKHPIKRIRSLRRFVTKKELILLILGNFYRI